MIKPGDFVLVKYYEHDGHTHWKLGIYSHEIFHLIYLIGDKNSYKNKEVIPYKGNEDLLGKRVMDTGQLNAGE